MKLEPEAVEKILFDAQGQAPADPQAFVERVNEMMLDGDFVLGVDGCFESELYVEGGQVCARAEPIDREGPIKRFSLTVLERDTGVNPAAAPDTLSL